MGRISWIVLLAWIAALAAAACGGIERDSPSVGSSPEPALFLAGDGQLTVVDVDAGGVEVRPLVELAPGDPPHRIVRRGNKLVFWGRDTYVLDLDQRSSPRKLGNSWFFIPSAKPDRVWLAQLDPASPETVRALAGVREVSMDGRVTFPHVRPPGGRWPVVAVGDHLVFEDRRGGLELWNPATGEFTLRLPGASRGPSHSNLLAWCERDGRTLHITHVGSGRDQTVTSPPGFVAFDCWSGAFSPDGTSLAVPVRAGGYAADRSLALVDLTSGAADAVEGSTVHPDYVFVAWSSEGDRIFLSGGPDDERHLLQYRLGEPRAVPLAVEVRDFYGMAAR
jgi:hypothetical protein